MINTVKELRNELKKVGFNLKVKNINFMSLARVEQRFAIVIDKNKKEIPSHFTKESLEYWKPALDILNIQCKKVILDSNNNTVIVQDKY